MAGLRSAIVTGAARGIGRAIADRLHADGYGVLLADVDEAAVASAAAELGDRAQGIAADVSSPSDARMLIERAVAEWGRLDVLVNCAGIMRSVKIDELTPEAWDRTMAVNLRGPFLLSQAALPHFRAQKHGRIINISSLAGQSGGVMVGADYSASKGGLIALTKVLARELAPYGATANCVAPGTTESAMAASFTPEQREKLLSMIPLGRFARPEEIASLVAFLASDEAGYITGATISINGGLLMV